MTKTIDSAIQSWTIIIFGISVIWSNSKLYFRLSSLFSSGFIGKIGSKLKKYIDVIKNRFSTTDT